MVAFDTLKLAQRLEAAGMPPQQAQGTAAALAETLVGDLVTREYLDHRLAELEGRLESRMIALENRMLRWLITQTFALVGAVAAIVGVAAALTRLIH